MKLNQFSEDLQYSLSQADDPMWLALYRKAFPNLKRIWTVQDQMEQQRGRDRCIELTNGHSYFVEEKKRRRLWGDILLEYISNDVKRTPGWIERDLAVDFVAYAFMETRRAYLLPWPLLRRAWNYYGKEWIKLGQAREDGFSIVVAPNPTYRTYGVGVPVNTLLKTMRIAMVINF